HISQLHPLLLHINTPPTTDIYTLSLHDALPISFQVPSVLLQESAEFNMMQVFVLRINVPDKRPAGPLGAHPGIFAAHDVQVAGPDRKSTRLNSSHDQISYAVFCLKKKNRNNREE